MLDAIFYDTTNCYMNINNQVIKKGQGDKYTKLWTLLLQTNLTPTPPIDNEMWSIFSTCKEKNKIAQIIHKC